MSLDVTLYYDHGKESYVCDHCGSTAECDSHESVFKYNITHNLNTMAEALGVYKELWRPEDLGITKASELIEPLKAAYAKLIESPGVYKQYAPKNGWGSYENLLDFLNQYLEACRKYPEALISASR